MIKLWCISEDATSQSMQRARSTERILQRDRETHHKVIPGVKQTTLKLINMKPSPPPPPKPLFIVPKQPNPPVCSSPVPSTSDTISGLVYFDGNNDFGDCSEVAENNGEEKTNDQDNGDLDVECQVHRSRNMSSSMSNASFPASGNTTTYK